MVPSLLLFPTALSFGHTDKQLYLRAKCRKGWEKKLYTPKGVKLYTVALPTLTPPQRVTKEIVRSSRGERDSPTKGDKRNCTFYKG